ncbi:MAG: coenzyme F420-0:L-glutamate ligase [Candidatus Bathyarchaeia archaeon]
MVKYLAKAIKTGYWKPGDDFIKIIIKSLNGYVKDNDIVVLSEKAISTALGKIVDESKSNPGFTAKIIVLFWIKKVWGYFLGPICHLNKKNIERLRNYPIKEGLFHKQTTLNYAGLFQSLKHWSEGGIDVSNVPSFFACLPLENPKKIAEKVFKELKKFFNKHLIVVIVDSDKTFSFRNLHLASRKTQVKGIMNLGLLAYLIGRIFKLRPRSTPLASFGMDHENAEELLQIAAVANKARGSGAGRTIWDVAERFGVSFTAITTEMLEKVEHFPIVIVRKISAC